MVEIIVDSLVIFLVVHKLGSLGDGEIAKCYPICWADALCFFQGDWLFRKAVTAVSTER